MSNLSAKQHEFFNRALNYIGQKNSSKGKENVVELLRKSKNLKGENINNAALNALVKVTGRSKNKKNIEAKQKSKIKLNEYRRRLLVQLNNSAYNNKHLKARAVVRFYKTNKNDYNRSILRGFKALHGNSSPAANNKSVHSNTQPAANNNINAEAIKLIKRNINQMKNDINKLQQNVSKVSQSNLNNLKRKVNHIEKRVNDLHKVPEGMFHNGMFRKRNGRPINNAEKLLKKLIEPKKERSKEQLNRAKIRAEERARRREAQKHNSPKQ